MTTANTIDQDQPAAFENEAGWEHLERDLGLAPAGLHLMDPYDARNPDESYRPGDDEFQTDR